MSTLPSTAYQGDPADFERKRPYPPEVTQAVVAALADYLTPGDTVADVGAGSGVWAVPLAGQGYPVLALDLSPKMLAYLRSKGASGVLPILADAHTLPLASASLPAVVSVHTLHLMEDLPRAVAEIVRVLWPGGWFFLGYVDHLPGSVVGWAIAAWRAMLREAGYDLDRPAWRDQAEIIPVVARFLRHEKRLTPARWTATVTPNQVVAGALHRNYTLYWGLDDETHRRFGDRLQRLAAETFGDLDQPHLDPRQFVWEVFRKN